MFVQKSQNFTLNIRNMYTSEMNSKSLESLVKHLEIEIMEIINTYAKTVLVYRFSYSGIGQIHSTSPSPYEHSFQVVSISLVLLIVSMHSLKILSNASSQYVQFSVVLLLLQLLVFSLSLSLTQSQNLFVDMNWPIDDFNQFAVVFVLSQSETAYAK